MPRTTQLVPSLRARPLRTGLPDPVILRRLSAADAPAFAQHIAADVDRLGEHLPWPARTTTPEGAARWLGAYDRREEGRVVVGGAWRGGDLLGGALLLSYDETHANIEIGCWLVAAAEGHGVAAAACRELLSIARAELGVERVEWHSATTNVRSRRLAERLGFRHEGTLRSNFVLRGARLDTDVLSLVGGEIDQAGSSALE